MLEELRKRNALLLKMCKNKHDQVYIKLEVIRRLLMDDKCFFKISLDEGLAILSDLGYKDNEALNIYKQLVSGDAYFDLYCGN